jgi:hypothetical protein
VAPRGTASAAIASEKNTRVGPEKLFMMASLSKLLFDGWRVVAAVSGIKGKALRDRPFRPEKPVLKFARPW